VGVPEERPVKSILLIGDNRTVPKTDRTSGTPGLWVASFYKQVPLPGSSEGISKNIHSGTKELSAWRMGCGEFRFAVLDGGFYLKMRFGNRITRITIFSLFSFVICIIRDFTVLFNALSLQISS
jgi:hypothetical protein